MPRDRLPVDEVLPALADAVRAGRNVVLVAPPGAGKTTRVPQALLDLGALPANATVLVLEPRRLAARLAAQRIAFERGVKLGDEVGYQVRFDDRTSRNTRIALLTEGILTRRIQSDASLDGVGAVVLDEIHERSVHADLALAFLREVQETIRPDLRIIAMSATLDAAPLAQFLGDAAIIKSEGRQYPVQLEYLEAPDDRSIPDLMVSGIRRILRTEESGDILAFLPGAGEIRRVETLLREHVGDKVEIAPLYGDLSADAQDRALTRRGLRKVVLATNIAESSLTIEGITTVVDAGFAKVLRHDPALGVDRLELVRIGRKSADQRTGRAGRTGPGRALRLWTEKEDRLLVGDESPEIMRVDLAPVMLEVLRWAPSDPRKFGWFDAPPPAMIDRALSLLRLLGALKADTFALTPLGEQLARIPLHPRLSRLMMAAAHHGDLETGALVAALASERDIVRRTYQRQARVSGESDLVHRMELFRELESRRFSGDSAERLGLDANAARAVAHVREQLREVGRRTFPKAARASMPSEEVAARALLAAYPDRVARRRAVGDERVVLATGGGGRIAPESIVKDAELLVALDVESAGRVGKELLIRQASEIQRSWLDEETSGVEVVHGVKWNRERAVVESVREVRYRELVLESRPSKGADEGLVSQLLESEARADLEHAVPLTEGALALVQRVTFLRKHMPELDFGAVEGDLRSSVLPSMCVGRRSFEDLRKASLEDAIGAMLPHATQRALDTHAPTAIDVPSGRRATLRYEADGLPVLAIRLQEVFGMTRTPRVANGRVSIKLELLAPNYRPVQVTQDLESFWSNTYGEVRNELRRRYPKHQWPEDPRQGDPTKKPGRR